MKEFFLKYCTDVDIIKGNNTNHFFIKIKALIINETHLVALLQYGLDCNDRVIFNNKNFIIKKIERFDIYEVATLSRE